jgi:hypothetical protein
MGFVDFGKVFCKLNFRKYFSQRRKENKPPKKEFLGGFLNSPSGSH